MKSRCGLRGTIKVLSKQRYPYLRHMLLARVYDKADNLGHPIPLMLATNVC